MCPMSKPTEQTVKRLFALSGNLCAFPGCSLPMVEATGVVTGEICHIHARRSGGPRFAPDQTEKERQAFNNLILMCGPHHKVIDSQPDIYSADVLREMKSVHEAAAGRPEQPTDGVYAKILLNHMDRIEVVNNSGNVAINSPGAIQAGTVVLKTTRKSVTVTPPPNTVGADAQLSRYVQYLISRYNEFAGSDPRRATAFNPSVISKNIEHKFGAPWRLLSVASFDEVCGYLQQRISKTSLAKLNTSKGRPSFSSYADHLRKNA